MLAQVGDDGKVLAGGQSLLPILNMRLAAPALPRRHQPLAELAYVRARTAASGSVRWPGTPTSSGDGRRTTSLPLLRQALGLVAHPVIRNRGTTVGSLAHADPSGEMTAVLALTGGSVEVARQGSIAHRGRGRLLPRPARVGAARRASSPCRRTSRRSPAGTGSTFVEVARRHGDYAVCGLAAAVTLTATARSSSARAAYISVAPTPLVLDLTDGGRRRGGRGRRLGRGRRARAGAGRPRGGHPRQRRLPAPPGAAC